MLALDKTSTADFELFTQLLVKEGRKVGNPSRRGSLMKKINISISSFLLFVFCHCKPQDKKPRAKNSVVPVPVAEEALPAVQGNAANGMGSPAPASTIMSESEEAVSENLVTEKVLFSAIKTEHVYADGLWIFELEDAPIKTGKIEIYSDPDGAKGIIITEASVEASKAYLKLDFNIEPTSAFADGGFIYLKALAPSANSDSVYFSLNNTEQLGWYFFSSATEYQLMRANNCGGGNADCPLREAFSFKPGNNFIEIKDREAGIKLDALIISKKPDLKIADILSEQKSTLTIEIPSLGQTSEGTLKIVFSCLIQDETYKLSAPHFVNDSEDIYDFHLINLKVNSKDNELYHTFNELQKTALNKGDHALEESGQEKILTVLKEQGPEMDTIEIVYSLKKSN